MAPEFEDPDAILIYAPDRFLLVDAERREHAALRDLVKAGGLGHGRRADRTELVAQVEAGGDGKTNPAADSGDTDTY